MRLVIGLGLFAFTLGCAGQEAAPFAMVSLDKAVPRVDSCEAKPDRTVNQELWIDDENLAVSMFSSCQAESDKSFQYSYDLIVVGSDGKTKVSHRGDAFGMLRGPVGTLILNDGVRVDLMNSRLETQQTITCTTQTRCAAFSAPQGMVDSIFAVCSEAKPNESCDFYGGTAAVKLTGRTASVPMFNGALLRNPYGVSDLMQSVSAGYYETAAWEVSSSEVWSFDRQGVLISSPSKLPVTSEVWAPKFSNCAGELSVTVPQRFLAICFGSHVYTDGMLDGLFGYSRIALFDVKSRHIIKRINGPAYTSAALSPDGKLIAAEHLSKIKLYRVN